MPTRPKQNDMPFEGPGVALPKIKELDKLGDKFVELRDQKADLNIRIADLEKEIIQLMHANGIAKYLLDGQTLELKEATLHVKIKKAANPALARKSGADDDIEIV